MEIWATIENDNVKLFPNAPHRDMVSIVLINYPHIPLQDFEVFITKADEMGLLLYLRRDIKNDQWDKIKFARIPWSNIASIYIHDPESTDY